MENVLEFLLKKFIKTFKMKKIILFSLIIIGMLVSCEEKEATKITISNNGINKLNIQDCITIDHLKTTFINYKITSKKGKQNGVNYNYFEVTKENTNITFIMNKLDNCLINEINLTTSYTDKYGVKIGMSYKEVKKLRPNTFHKTDARFHTILSTPDSKLKYEISGTFDEPDKQNFIYNDVKKWKVTQFLVRSY